MKTKCYQCEEEIEQSYIPGKKIIFEVCFNCGYVRKITWQQMDTDNHISKIMDILEDEKSSDEQKVLSIKGQF